MASNSDGTTPIRGVNLGGWLLSERFITPYLFALTDCHVRGEFCWYPGQLGAPVNGTLCKDMPSCKPLLKERTSKKMDYPIDSYTLLDSFENKAIAKRYMEHHWSNFVTYADLEQLKLAGITHVRVPLPHWIRGDILEDEPWITGGWLYFIRLAGWCRSLGLQIWPDLHTAPGSQNGFDNSGQFLGEARPTGRHWSENPQHVQRTLDAVREITRGIVKDGLQDVVTGFGVLNEPFKDCDFDTVKDYDARTTNIVRETLGPDTAVYIGDLFNATIWNSAQDMPKNLSSGGVYLDSHYYHVFDQRPRHLSPRQHIAFVCQKQYRDATSCCSENNGMKRMIGEWSAAFDTLVDAQLDRVMEGIADNGTAPFLHRTLEPARQDFLKHYVQAQMVTYETTTDAWFYWTLKTEGGAFAEWDFLRGLDEGWMTVPTTKKSAEKEFGTCHEIMFDTKDDYSIIHEYPNASSLDPDNWQGVDIDDDVVTSHGESLLKRNATTTTTGAAVVVVANHEDSHDTATEIHPPTTTSRHWSPVFSVVLVVFAVVAIKKVFFNSGSRGKKDRYTELQSGENHSLLV